MALTKVTGSVIKDSVSLSGNVSVGGTLTYQDVTNVDALGIGTFRTGIKVLAGQVDVGSNIKLGNAGVITATSFSGVMSGTTGSFSGQVNVGSNIKLGTAGVVTATSFVGSGANLTGLPVPGGATNLDLLDSSGTGNGRIRLGASQDLQIYHDGSHSWFKNTTGRLLLQTDGDQIQLRGNTIVAFNGAASTEYLRIDSSGRVLIGTTTEGEVNADDLTIATSANTGMTIRSGTSNFGSIYFSDGTSGNAEYRGIIAYNHSNNYLQIYTAASERLRIDSSGRLLIGTTSHQEAYGTSALQIAGTSGATSSMSLIRHGNSPYLTLGSSGGSSLGAVTALSSGDRIGQLTFAGADGTDINTHAASIAAYVDGSVSSNNVPARIVFATGPSETERLRIASDGNLQLNSYSGNAGQGRISFGNSGPAFIEGYDSGNAGSGAYLRFQVTNNEKVRIPRDTWGLLVTNQGSTGNTGGYQTEGVSLRYSGDSTFVKHNAAAVTMTRQATAGKVLDFYSGTSYAGGVYVNGQNSAQYQSTSDYRLKEDIASMTDGIDKVKLLNPVYYKNKQIGDVTDTTTVNNGFLAHEVQSVIPTLVDGEKDGNVDERGKGYQTLNYAGFAPTAIAAIKELIAKVETLEAKVAALEGS